MTDAPQQRTPQRHTIPNRQPPVAVVVAGRPILHVASASRGSNDVVTARRAATDEAVDRVLARIAAGQHGLVTRRQALTAGVGAGAIRDRLRRGALHPEHRGVYLVGHPVRPPLAREHAAVLACGPRVLVAGRSSAALWRLPVPGDLGDLVEVLAVGRQVRSRPRIEVRRTERLAAADVRRIEGIPVTSPARTIVDLAGRVTPDALERLVHEAQVLRLASPHAATAALERAGAVAGGLALRAVLETGTRGVTRSEAESALRRLVSSAGLPRPVLNARLGKYVVDALWAEARLVVEVDGFRFHGTRRAFERDRRRDVDLQAAGYRVVRLTWRQLQREPVAVAARLATLLATSARHPSLSRPA